MATGKLRNSQSKSFNLDQSSKYLQNNNQTTSPEDLSAVDRLTILFPYLSFSKTQEALDCSRNHIYNLIERGILTPKFLGKKPYFSVSEMIAALSEKPHNDFK